MAAVEIEQVSKSYPLKKGRVSALRDVSFDVKEGELFGLIGPDGAGKTTLFRLLTTLLLPDKGTLKVNGKDTVRDFMAIRKEIGYMPGRFSLYMDLTVEENLNFFARIFNTSVKENYGMIKNIYHQIEPFKHFKAGKLSGGMKQKLALSCALIHRPRTLFLDEPTTGVDAVSRKEFWERLRELCTEGLTIIVSTPYMDEASLCERVALIQKGKIMQVNTTAGLKASFGHTLLAVRGPGRMQYASVLKKRDDVEDVYPFGDAHHVVLKKGVDRIVLPEGLVSHAIEPDIEDCFISLMKSHA